MERTFSANHEEIQKLEKKRTSEILQIIGYGLLSLMFLLYRREEQLRSLAREFDTTMHDARGWLTFFFAVAVICMICAIFVAIDVDSKIDKLKRSYIKITDDGVFGMSSSGSEFYIAYDDIRQANANEESNESLVIFGRNISYQCLAITNAAEAVQQINRKIDGKELNLPEESQFTEENTGALKNDETVSGETEAHFLNCTSDYVICPFCNTKQKSNRSLCFGCGAEFVFEYE